MIKSKLVILSLVSLFTAASASVAVFYALNQKKPTEEGIVKYVNTEYASMDLDANELFSSNEKGVAIKAVDQVAAVGDVITDKIKSMSGEDTKEPADDFSISSVSSKLVYSDSENNEIIPENTFNFDGSKFDASSVNQFNKYISAYSKDTNNLDENYKHLKITNNVISVDPVINGFETRYVLHNYYSFDNNEEVYNMCGILKTTANSIDNSIVNAKKSQVSMKLMTKFTIKCLLHVNFDYTDTTDRKFLHFQDDGHYLSKTNILDWVRRDDIWKKISDYIHSRDGANINFNLADFVKKPFDRENFGMSLNLANVVGVDGSYNVGSIINTDDQIYGSDKLYLQISFSQSNYIKGTCSIIIDGFNDVNDLVSVDKIDNVLDNINKNENKLETSFDFDSDFNFMKEVKIIDNLKNFNSNWFGLGDNKSKEKTFMSLLKEKLTKQGVDLGSIDNISVKEIDSSYVDGTGAQLSGYKKTKKAEGINENLKNFSNMSSFLTENINKDDYIIKSETTTYKDLNGPDPVKDIKRRTSYIFSTVDAEVKGNDIKFNPTAFGENESIDSLDGTSFSQDEFTSNYEKYFLHNTYKFEITIGKLFGNWESRKLPFGSKDYGFVTNNESAYQYLSSYSFYNRKSEELYAPYKNSDGTIPSYIGEKYYIANDLINGDQQEFFSQLLYKLLNISRDKINTPDKLVDFIQIVGAYSEPSGAVEEKNVIYDKKNNSDKNKLTENHTGEIYIGIQIKGLTGIIYYQAS